MNVTQRVLPLRYTLAFLELVFVRVFFVTGTEMRLGQHGGIKSIHLRD